MVLDSKKIQTLFSELGITVISKGVTESPLCTLYHFNIINIRDFDNIEKNVSTIAKFLKQDLTYEESSFAHFAIRLNKIDRPPIMFDCKEFLDLIPKPDDYDRYNELKIIAGVDSENKPITFDLNDNPHILIAGTTGSGKSMMLNNVICDLLLHKNGLNFAFIDTKKIELSRYKKLNNLWHKVITESNDALEYLQDICFRIDYIYEQIEKDENYEITPTIIVVDELNDLMMASKKSVEKYIVKIAQMGRACGVHLIIATQRPTVDVLTGNIKANIDCRIALKTASAVDSRVILDHNGAEKLIGKGDALLKLPTNDKEIHIQCPFVDVTKIPKIIEFYNQGD